MDGWKLSQVEEILNLKSPNTLIISCESPANATALTEILSCAFRKTNTNTLLDQTEGLVTVEYFYCRSKELALSSWGKPSSKEKTPILSSPS